MKLADFQIAHEELIIGSRLRDMLAGVPGVQYEKLDHMTRLLPATRVLVTGNSDYPVDDRAFHYFNPPKWFAQNCEGHDPRLVGRPIGHQEPVTPILGNTQAIVDKAQETKHVRNLAYVGWRDSTYFAREGVKALYAGKPWVTCDPWRRDEFGYQRYLDGLYNHKFVVSPRGNGWDCIRTWDALVLRTIPIVERCAAMIHFEDLPILWVDTCWPLSEDRLEREYERIMSTEYDLRPLTLSYWVDRITEAAK